MAGGEVRVELLTSRVKGKARAATLEALAGGAIDVVVGTHALLTEDVEFALPRRRRDRRAAPLRRGAAGRPARQGRRPVTRTSSS